MSQNILTSKSTMKALHKFIMYTILLEAFFIGLFPVVAEIALLAGFIVFLYKWKWDDNFHYQRTKFFWPITVFVVCGLISITGSPDPGFSFYNFYNLVGVYLMTYVMVTQNVTNRKEIMHIMMALLFSMILVIGYGFLQYIVGIDTADMKWVDGEAFPELKKRIFSTWENPNILAAYLDIAICVMLGVFVKIDKNDIAGKHWRRYLLFGIICAAACLAMTYARGACLTIAVIVAGYGIMKDKRILLGVIAVIAIALLSNPVLLDRMTTAFSMADTSSTMRLAMWESTWQMILDHPLRGIGWGAYWMVYPLYDFYIVDGSVMLVHAHNIYLNYIAEIGIIGGLAYFIWFFGSMYTALGTDRCLSSRVYEGLRFGLGLALISVALNGFTDDVLFNIPSSMLLWMICALIQVIDKRL